jgi:hypothetical protein
MQINVLLLSSDKPNELQSTHGMVLNRDTRIEGRKSKPKLPPSPFHAK